MNTTFAEQFTATYGGIVCDCSPEKNHHLPMPISPSGSCPHCGKEGSLYRAALEHAKLNGRGHSAEIIEFPEPYSEPWWEDKKFTGDDLPDEEITGDDLPEIGASWKPVDLTSVLSGEYHAPMPVIGCRDDGKGLFYPGRIHSVAAETEAGKTWFALLACMTEISKCHNVIFFDFEDDEGGVVTRLISMGADTEQIREHFIYVRPEEPVTKDALKELLTYEPALVIIDGMTEAMSLHGFDMLDNKGTADFGRKFPKKCAKAGAAVVIMDHVVKDRDKQDGNAIGAVHKVNGLNGAMFILENAEPFGIGLEGRSQVYIRKDRPGQLRRHGVPSKKRFHYCDLVVKSHGEEFAECSLPAPVVIPGAVPGKPTALMVKISRCLEDAGTDGKSGNGIYGAVGGRKESMVNALELLVSEKYVSSEKKGNGVLYKSVVPYGK